MRGQEFFMLRPITIVDTRAIVAEHFRTAIRRRREEVHIVERYVAAPEIRSTESREPFSRDASRPHQRLRWLWPSYLDHRPRAGPEFVRTVVIRNRPLIWLF